jgi:signal transduction histidine kinase
MAIPKSIRWRLPLSYASIALLATIALGAVLVTTLRGYYALREHDNLQNNAQLISDIVGRMYERGVSQEDINQQINTFAIMSQARVQLYNPAQQLLIDSGNPTDKRFIVWNVNREQATGIQTTFYGDNQVNLSVTGAALAQSPTFLRSLDAVITAISRALGISGLTRPLLLVGSTSAISTVPAINPYPGEMFPNERFDFMVSGSPFGMTLRRDMSVTTRSSQAVMVPLFGAGEKMIGQVEVSNGPAYGTEIIEGMTSALIVAGAVAVVLAAGVGWFISRSMTAPLLALTAATTEMAQGQLSARVSLDRPDEFGVLAHSFDEMAQRVEATVSALRRFVADAAHQIHTPLTAVHADLELAASEPDRGRQQMFIERARAQLKRLEALTNDLLDLSRLEAHDVDEARTTVDLAALVREISETFASRAEQAGIAFNVEISQPSIKAQVNETQFRHAIANLLDNAIKFTPENGTITVGVRRDGDQVELWVNDTGIGISSEDLPQLFDRFHRGRNAAAYPGSGLGLAIIKAIVEGHHGEIRVRSRAGDGTHFALRVPTGA